MSDLSRIVAHIYVARSANAPSPNLPLGVSRGALRGAGPLLWGSIGTLGGPIAGGRFPRLPLLFQ